MHESPCFCGLFQRKPSFKSSRLKIARSPVQPRLCPSLITPLPKRSYAYLSMFGGARNPRFCGIVPQHPSGTGRLPRRQSLKPPTYRLHKSSGQAVVTLSDPNGMSNWGRSAPNNPTRNTAEFSQSGKPTVASGSCESSPVRW